MRCFHPQDKGLGVKDVNAINSSRLDINNSGSAGQRQPWLLEVLGADWLLAGHCWVLLWQRNTLRGQSSWRGSLRVVRGPTVHTSALIRKMRVG